MDQRDFGLRAPRRCPGCGLVMSLREEDEQGMCNDCNGDPDPERFEMPEEFWYGDYGD